ncbi:FAD-dependent oxidoreductase [Oscillatoriales cyanobacterium LEGE 11467]|uniref:FAD-dependent oxidoreductase n=1 Tax=Zarconia navalis LEGE 11467 TaxID=1828826 RepID=A0A928VVH4_9CYAN|nr:FAD-dependent oxidoreductase [Zarconia navalis]MBE9040038.1 FAD-dependent oxidoreductase [Zarconia navalis LEGE 11467]
MVCRSDRAKIPAFSASGDYDAVVIGGGFFGCKIALYLKEHLDRVLIVEREADLLQRASYTNQARVHNGYHYPRSLLTALRSSVNFPRFVEEYRDCIDNTFDKYYAIARVFSKVNASQFQIFCQRIGIPIEPAKNEISSLFNPALIEAVFKTQEYAFDAVKLKQKIREELEREKIEIWLNTCVDKVQETTSGKIKVLIRETESERCLRTRYLFNCTYSQISQILKASDLPTIPLKYEFAEMALVDVPPELKSIGITVMCGPFFSLMPFPPRGLHTLSHVRYTPHYYWQESENLTIKAHEAYSQIRKQTNFPFSIRDTIRYLPIAAECEYIDSLWGVKTVLPQSEVDDSRPILFKQNPKLPNLYCVLGGKIDNIYDIPRELNGLHLIEGV